ncbi:MAG: hypothetical protein HY908_37340 [Myxococcales bacterium]|nr:hypothetical protein [Myxococcales bacterium]
MLTRSWPMTLCLFLSGAGVCASSGCRPAVAPTPALTPTPAVRPAIDKPRSADVLVEVVPAPAALRVDGDPSEWGARPAGAGAWVMLSLTSTGLALLASLPEVEPVSLAVADPFDGVLPALGWEGTHAGFRPLTEEHCRSDQQEDYSTGPEWLSGKEHDAPVVAECLALLRHHEDVLAAYRERFVRRYRLDRQGVHFEAPDGSVVAIDGASARSRVGLLEASLPLGALPRLHHATLESVAVTATAGAPPGAVAAWRALRLPAAVRWPPHVELRAFFLDEANWSRDLAAHVAYDPRAPDELTVLRRSDVSDFRLSAEADAALHLRFVSVQEERLPLATAPVAQLGAVAVATVSDGLATHLVTMLGEALRSHRPFDGYDVRETTPRGGDLHVFAFHSGVPSWHSQGGYEVPAHWLFLRVARDGTLTSVGDDNPESWWSDFEAQPFVDAAFTRFGIRGTLADGRHASAVWSWDGKRYASKLE